MLDKPLEGSRREQAESAKLERSGPFVLVVGIGAGSSVGGCLSKTQNPDTLSLHSVHWRASVTAFLAPFPPRRIRHSSDCGVFRGSRSLSSQPLASPMPGALHSCDGSLGRGLHGGIRIRYRYHFRVKPFRLEPAGLFLAVFQPVIPFCCRVR
ncbi:hypothetical protein BT67DRAFT_156334 [Trichocladium antarcticum]|uniref:Uncharacterized protein n=1 Tax=Trichocladium antarcticum TaxID=1450529 RepID=A0AAN6ZA40_9PEZI|nr:hypothetical protein BT67DRAFT_156334 [Trichocladium antarcticum]